MEVVADGNVEEVVGGPGAVAGGLDLVVGDVVLGFAVRGFKR